MDCVVVIPADEYEIGDDSVPNAGPRHRRRRRKAIWMDTRPVSWELFENYVVGGGYVHNELWPTPAGRLGVNQFGSVDLRCRAVLQQSQTCWKADAFEERISLEYPVTGLTWFEAYSLAKFYGARLPFEVEWEIAMRNEIRPKAKKRLCAEAPWKSFPVSDRGFVETQGTLQEWTLDGFHPQYWRSDFNRSGIPWSPETHPMGVSVRGSSPLDTHSHVCFRVGRSPEESHPYRTFRRVWDNPPTSNQIEG